MRGIENDASRLLDAFPAEDIDMGEPLSVEPGTPRMTSLRRSQQRKKLRCPESCHTSRDENPQGTLGICARSCCVVFYESGAPIETP